MKELTIKADGIMTGLFDYKIRIAPKEANGQHRWDIWFQEKGRWVKKTKGNSYLRADTLQEVINKCLSCGDYTLSKTLISIVDI